MKVLSRLMALCILCAFWVSCTKQEESVKSTDVLDGTWKWEKTIVHNIQTVYPAPADPYYLRFSKEGSFTFLRDSTVLRSGTYRVSGQLSYQNTGSDQLTLKLSDDPGEYNLILNGMEMILQQNNRFGNPTSAYYQRQ